ncbi:MAG: peptidyl-prolyl cis-trans isomerase [Bacteroidales bacterium]
MKYLLLSLLLLLSLSCKNNMQGDDNVVVSIGENHLYKQELLTLIPVGISSADSQIIADRYIKRWIDDRLLYEVAQKNVPNMPNIREKVEQYHRDLVIFEYQKQLVDEKLSEEITDQEIQEYYDTHQDELVNDEPIAKGLFLQVRRNAPNINLVRKWVSLQSVETLENIEKYSLKQGVNYRYFYNEYLSLEQILSLLPSAVSSNAIKEKKMYEFTDSDYYYFLNISDFKRKGEVMPIEVAVPIIREHLLKIKATNYLEQQQSRLYKRAMEKNRIIFHSQSIEDKNE